ncbi:MAG: hypothetical protein R2792_15495 [Saprospiraceae bacterium]
MQNFSAQILVFLLLSCTTPTPSTPNSKPEKTAEIKGASAELDLQQLYTQAIADYIREVDSAYGLRFDTLYFGKHVFGQADDFPDIELPGHIAGTPVLLVSPEEGERIQREREAAFYVNLFGRTGSDRPDFLFVLFSKGFVHQFDVFIQYSRAPNTNEFVLDSARFERFGYGKD